MKDAPVPPSRRARRSAAALPRDDRGSALRKPLALLRMAAAASAQCSAPDTTGYDVVENDLSAQDFDVEVTCAYGYEGVAFASQCDGSGPYTVAGCSRCLYVGPGGCAQNFWELALNINPADGHNMGWGAVNGAEGWPVDGSGVGSLGAALSGDFMQTDAWSTDANYIAIARHTDGVCSAVKVWEFTTPGLSLHDYFAEDSGAVEELDRSGGYSDNEHETWTLSCQYAHHVPTLSFAAFDTEANFDFLRVYDGDSVASQQLA